MLTLNAGTSSLVVAPEAGGAIVGWTHARFPVLRRAFPDAIVTGMSRGLAAYPLVPFSNRIADARFRFNGQDYQLVRNFGDEPHMIHGVGWQSSWDVTEIAPHMARLALIHTAQGETARHWPFPFTAELRFELEPDALLVGLSMRNRHSGPAPAGLGLHPFFPRTERAELRFTASGVWKNGADHLPDAHMPVPPEWNHAQGKPVGSADLDNLFTGWPGTARVALAPSPLAIEMTASEIFSRLVVYTPPGRPYFAVEPVSHMTDAINRLESGIDTGLRILPPGEELAGEIRFLIATS